MSFINLLKYVNIFCFFQYKSDLSLKTNKNYQSKNKIFKKNKNVYIISYICSEYNNKDFNLLDI